MASWNTAPATIDQLFTDGTDYSIIFSHGMDAYCCEDCSSEPSDENWTDHVFTGHGVNGALEALARVLDVMVSLNDLDDFDEVPRVAQAQADLQSVTDRHNRMPGQLRDVRSEITRLTKMIEGAPDPTVSKIRKAIGQRTRLRKEENMLREVIGMRDSLINGARLGVELAEMVEKIVADAKNGTLDLDAPLRPELLNCGWVPGNEERRTVGAFIYHYVEHLADTSTSRLVIEKK